MTEGFQHPVAETKTSGAIKEQQHGDAPYAVVLATLVALCYFRTLAPGLLLNDSAELQTIVTLGGHTHPTGYCVYTCVARITQQLLPVDAAVAVNAFSALAAVVSCLLLFCMMRLVVSNRLVAFGAALTFGVSPTLWSQAIIAEVYTLGLCMCLAVLYAVMRWKSGGRICWLLMASFFGAVSIGIHSTVGLIAPAAMLAVLVDNRRKRGVLISMLGVAAGLATYAGTFLLEDSQRSNADYFRVVVEPSRSAWSLAESQSTIDRMRFHLPAKQYQSKVASDASAGARQLSWFLGNLSREVPLTWWPFAVFGLIRLVSKRSYSAALFGLTLLIQVAFIGSYNMGDIHVCCLPVYGIALCLGAIGADAACERLATRSHSAKKACDYLIVVVIGISLAFPVLEPDAWKRGGHRAVGVPHGEPEFDVAGETAAARFLREVIPDFEQDSVIIVDWEIVYALTYIAYVEQNRRDLTFVHGMPAVSEIKMAESLIANMRGWVRQRPVYTIYSEDPALNEFRVVEVNCGHRSFVRVFPRPGVLSTTDQSETYQPTVSRTRAAAEERP